MAYGGIVRLIVNVCFLSPRDSSLPLGRAPVRVSRGLPGHCYTHGLTLKSSTGTVLLDWNNRDALKDLGAPFFNLIHDGRIAES